MAKLERYLDSVAQIQARGVSAGKWVTVVRDATGNIDVSIRPGMLRRCSPDEVAVEIRGACLAALADHRRQYLQLRIDHFGSPLGAVPFVSDEACQERG